MGAGCENLVRESVLKFVRRNPGIVVMLGSPSSRKQNSALARYHLLHEHHLYASSCDLDCLLAAFVNACGTWPGSEVADKMRARMLADSMHFTKIGQVGNFVHRMGINCRIKKPSKGVRKMLHTDKLKSPFAWLAEGAKGVWIVRLVQVNVVDHCIALDADKSVIYDSEERHPIRITKESLEMCGGPGAKRLRVAEMFQLSTAKVNKVD